MCFPSDANFQIHIIETRFLVYTHPKGLLGTLVQFLIKAYPTKINQSHGGCFKAFRGVVLVKKISSTPN